MEEKPKGTKLTFQKQVCDVCMKVKDCFAKLLLLEVFFLSFFEVKVPPPILPEVFVLIFANQFHLCQLMFQSLLFAFQ